MIQAVTCITAPVRPHFELAGREGGWKGGGRHIESHVATQLELVL
jgi:hypothetical protein